MDGFKKIKKKQKVRKLEDGFTLNYYFCCIYWMEFFFGNFDYILVFYLRKKLKFWNSGHNLFWIIKAIKYVRKIARFEFRPFVAQLINKIKNKILILNKNKKKSYKWNDWICNPFSKASLSWFSRKKIQKNKKWKWIDMDHIMDFSNYLCLQI